MLSSGSEVIGIEGNPNIESSCYGPAVAFDGIDDALFLSQMPLAGMKEFTVEMIFKPEMNAAFEQRVLHIGEVKSDRVLLEIRAVDSNWYFDGFAASRGIKMTLADEKLNHPLGLWYHVAVVVSPRKMITYVNGIKELEAPYSFQSIEQGRTSIGVRMNKISWFKGSVYKIKITDRELKPNRFMVF